MDNFTLLKPDKEFVQQLLHKQKLPDLGLNKREIEYLLSYLSSMDSNNQPNIASVGEREGRCFSELIARRNFHFIHGIGRSGNLTEPQPKAIGSSIMYQLTNELLKDLLSNGCECLLVPIPIGASLMICLSTFRLIRRATYVIWFREDDEIIFNTIINAGFEPVIIDTFDEKVLRNKIEGIGPDKITCVISSSFSTSYFPKENNIMEIGEICNEYKIPHIINNNCGLQSKNITDQVNKICELGKVDVVIQNAGENFMIPVGSTLLTSPRQDMLGKIANTYPGRASSSSVIDILITLLSIGKNGYYKHVEERENLFEYFNSNLKHIHEFYKDVIIKIHTRQLSTALYFKDNIEFKQIDILRGSCNLIKVNVISKSETKVLGKYEFGDWGTHGQSNSGPYITFRIPLATPKEEVTSLLECLDKFLSDIKNY